MKAKFEWIVIYDEVKKIKQNWLALPKSVRFWNLLALFSLITIGIISYELLVVVWIFASIFIVAKAIDGDITENDVWMWFIPITWCVIALGIIGGILYLIYMNTIVRFNAWLDKEKD